MATKSFLFLASIIILTGCETNISRPGTPGSAPAPVPTNGRTLSVGLFLGPGAMRAYAHIGVLRAFQRAQIPLAAIGGVEWGSLIAASYATGTSVNETEWEMMKLKKEQLPAANLLNRDLKPRDPQQLFEFLSAAFGNKDLGSTHIPFRCPTNDSETVFQGKAREELLKCAVLPPLYDFYFRAGRTYVAGALSPSDWGNQFKAIGAQYLVYVDVITRGNFLTDSRYSQDSELKALWLAVRSISRLQHSVANFTIEIPSDIDLGDYEHRREAIALGERVAEGYMASLKQAIGIN